MARHIFWASRGRGGRAKSGRASPKDAPPDPPRMYRRIRRRVRRSLFCRFLQCRFLRCGRRLPGGACRVALAGCLLCTLYRHSRNHWKKSLKIFGDILRCLRLPRGDREWEADFRNSCEGLFKDLRTLFLRALLGTKFWKILKKICRNQSRK